MRGIGALLVLCGCAGSLPAADRPGAAGAYRAELERHPKGDRAREARRLLEEAEFASARSAHTILSYRAFLSEFPGGARAGDARALLEGLRWAQAEQDGSEAALRGYLADEPSGSHAAQAWALLAQARLASAIASRDPAALRAWLAANPAAPGRERAQVALETADFVTAGTDLEALRAYLSAHPDGPHRGEAQALLDRAELDEAIVLEDEPRLRAFAGGAEVAERIAYQRAAALLDESRLAQIARRGGRFAAEAAALLEALPRAPAVEQDAHRLFLPRATPADLPQDTRARAAALSAWAIALDGARLQRLVAEIASPRVLVALSAQDAARKLLVGLPQAEARLRARRLLARIMPVAQAAPQLAQVALLEQFLRLPAALQTARAAAGRDARSIPALREAAALEAEQGDPAVAVLAAQALSARARGVADEHAEAARTGNEGAAGELCAASIAATEAADLARRVVAASATVQVLSTQAELLRRRIAETRAACDHDSLDRTAAEFAQERREAAARLAASRSLLAPAALERARRRDPDGEVRAAAYGTTSTPTSTLTSTST